MEGDEQSIHARVVSQHLILPLNHRVGVGLAVWVEPGRTGVCPEECVGGQLLIDPRWKMPG